jgi:hypothetical protein
MRCIPCAKSVRNESKERRAERTLYAGQDYACPRILACHYMRGNGAGSAKCAIMRDCERAFRGVDSGNRLCYAVTNRGIAA